ncbi:hypothetical protein HDK90DRAFT_546293 [Phyllosticta capitalensis]|uniref:DUF7918 domain-containing protein n=1 Tax=Phyllosticta capitalensis TaxID=121624 RepID=A0ABR1YYV9_9PEZI
MPRLKDIKCSIELPPENEPLPEYHSVYTDGLVETYVAIPQEPRAFNIHVTSEGFIARGLAVFVFIDGVYQCMRFRGDLVEEDYGSQPQDTEVDFRFRQKEEKVKDDRFIAREWRFDKLNVAATDAKAHRTDEIGTIEVVVLRLRGMEAPAEVRAMYSGYDGADDDSDEESEDNFGAAFDGPSDFRESKRPPRDKESLVVAPSSTTGTSTATRDLVPGDGYYNLYRPYGRRNSATPSELADQAARRRFRPGVDYRDGKVFWTRPKDLFTVPAETMNGSDSPRGSLVSEANRRPAQDRERGRNHSRRGTKVGAADAKDSTEQPATTWDNNADVAQPGPWDGNGDTKSQKSKSSKSSQKNDDANFNSAGWDNPVDTENAQGDTGNAADDNTKDDNANANEWDNNNVNTSAWPDNNVDTSGDWNKDNGSKKDEQAAVEPSVKDNGSHKTKSRRSSKAPSSISYMHVPSIPEEPVFKSYWKDWHKRPAEQKSRIQKYVENAPSDFTVAPTEVPEQVPERVAKKRGLDHQVYAGKATHYHHRLGVPVYKDTMEHPYAVFRYKYRSRETLEKMLGPKILEKVKKQEKQQKLMNMSKEELVEQLMKKTSISGKSGSAKPSVKAPEAAEATRTTSWVEEQAKVPSESRPKSRSSKEPVICDKCDTKMKKDDSWWHCEPCDQDLCRGCVKKDVWCKDDDHQLERWAILSDGEPGGNAEWLQPKKKSKNGGSQSGKSSGNGGGSQKAKSASKHGSSKGSKNGGSQAGDQWKNAGWDNQDASGGQDGNWNNDEKKDDKKETSSNCAAWDAGGQW